MEALNAYQYSVDTWFPKFANRLKLRVLMPVHLIGLLVFSNSGTEPSLYSYFEALPYGESNKVSFSIMENSQAQKEFFNLDIRERVDNQRHSLRFGKASIIGNTAFQHSGLKRKVFGILIHEITHWLDHTSTLWGQKFLIDIFNAFNAKNNENVDELWRIQQLFSDISRIYFADYYTVNGTAANKPWNNKNWRYQIGSGLQFDRNGKVSEKYPFLFTKFFTSDDEFIKRVPLSVVSLLETNAVAAELKLETALLSLLTPEAAFIENKLNEQNGLKRLYNPELTIYSVAAHCLANLATITDVVDAYFISSALSTLCLNLPSQVFPLLKIPSDVYETIGNRTKELLNIKDRGFAFFLIAQSAPQDNHSNILEWLESAVNKAGLPPIKQLEEMALVEMNELDKEILKEPMIEKFKEFGASAAIEDQFVCEYSRLKTLLKAGKKNFAKVGI